MFGLFGGTPDPKYWKDLNSKRKEEHKKEVNSLKADIAYTQYSIEEENRNTEIVKLQTDLVNAQTQLANANTQYVKAGGVLSARIKALNDAQRKNKQAIQEVQNQNRIFGIF